MKPTFTRPIVRGSRGVVACGHPLAASAALRVFAAGGGAVDAAIAAAAALSVVLPDACGLGGDAMALVRNSSGKVRAYNGSGAAPRELGLPIPHEGGGSVAVPGAVAAWGELHQHHGVTGLKEILTPAIELAENGFAIGEGLVKLLKVHQCRLARWAPQWRLNHSLVAGNLIRQPELAYALKCIASEGPQTFYEGKLADNVVAAVQRAGGTMMRSDLEKHMTSIGEPVQTNIVDTRLFVQPPVSQAILVPMVLHGLEAARSDAASRTHAAIELVEAAFALRNEISDANQIPRLLAAKLEFNPERASRRGGPRGYSHTAAVTTADKEGTVVSMLVSVFDDFGSAVLVPDGGFVLNNRLDGFLGQSGFPNSPRGGGLPVHTLSPVIVQQDDCAFALATPGADAQVQILIQLLDALIRKEASVAEVIARPRWASIDRELALEATFPANLATDLEARGHHLSWQPLGAPLFGAACVAGLDRESGTVYATTDPRRETWAVSI